MTGSIHPFMVLLGLAESQSSHPWCINVSHTSHFNPFPGRCKACRTFSFSLPAPWFMCCWAMYFNFLSVFWTLVVLFYTTKIHVYFSVFPFLSPPFLLPSVFPTSGSFPTSRLFASGGWSTGALASVNPSNKYSGLEIELNLLNSDSTSIHQQDRGQRSCADALCQAAPFPDQGPQILSLLSLSSEGISYFTKENASVFILPPAYFTSDPNLPEPCYVSFPPSLLTQWEGLPIFQ